MLPWPHRDWTQQLLGYEAPTEGRSTCHTCPVSGPDLPFRVVQVLLTAAAGQVQLQQAVVQVKVHLTIGTFIPN